MTLMHTYFNFPSSKIPKYMYMSSYKYTKSTRSKLSGGGGEEARNNPVEEEKKFDINMCGSEESFSK